ncbi:MAG: efflux RND transporter periplasmic adaptor subunit [Candidatus Omnitrophica bacterium]|nr:efflux RND transporter periplasmic adaptor subunit [Candidatus Omnitrophota bacterium]
MRNKKIRLFFALAVIVVVAAWSITKVMQKKTSGEVIKEMQPVVGSIRTFISCTGTVLPKNRLEIKPPVNGRIERILVKEGEKVTIGQILVLMSSTERAALLDAARGKGEAVLQYWEETYKSIPLPAPIDGEVIVATTQPGQTVTTSDAVVVLSDHLIVRAQVDETDIGKIALGMKAVITLDAYPDAKIKASVEHMYYESKTVNNVTIYEVDLVPENVPQFFRSGMNASVDFIQHDKENILVIPVEAVHTDNGESYVLLKQNNSPEPLKTQVTLGVSDDKNIEVLSGVTKDSRIMVKSKRYALPKNTAGKNPFMPGH